MSLSYTKFLHGFNLSDLLFPLVCWPTYAPIKYCFNYWDFIMYFSNLIELTQPYKSSFSVFQPIIAIFFFHLNFRISLWLVPLKFKSNVIAFGERDFFFFKRFFHLGMWFFSILYFLCFSAKIVSSVIISFFLGMFYV